MVAVGLFLLFFAPCSSDPVRLPERESCIYKDNLASFGNFLDPWPFPETPMTPLGTPLHHRTTLPVLAQAPLGALFLAMLVLCGSCASTSQQNNEAAALEKPGCISACAVGYECSTAVIQGVKTGLCIAKPTQCVSDADCANSAVLEGTVPLRYFCDQHSGAFPDKTGSSVIAGHGTCMPTIQTGTPQ
jgi:hypothetical protein